MKRLLSLLLCLPFLFSITAFAETLSQARIDSGMVGVWIENDGNGTLTVRLDGTAEMIYYDDTVTQCHWDVTDTGAKFTDGMWYNSPMELLEENTLSVAKGWMIFTREGFLPITDPAVLLNAVPVGEDGAAFLGQWTLSTLIMEGEEYDPAIFDMTMHLTFNADGTIVTDDGLEPYTTTWFVSYGSAVVEGDILVLNENDQLVLQASDGSMVFTRVPEETPTAPAGEESEEKLSEEELLLLLLSLMASTEDSTLPEEHQGFAGQWHLCYVATGGLTGDLRSMGVTGMLILNEDYTGVLSGIGDEEASWYEDEEGVIRFGESGMPMYLLGDETSPAGIFLQYGSEMGGYMIFHQDEEAVWDPAAYALQPSVPAPAADQSAAGSQATPGTRYVCTTYTAGGVTNDASILGVEYAVDFRTDGLVDFTMASFTMKDLGCTVAEDGARTIHYVGSDFLCVPTEAGFDMDYFGMILHMVPAE